MNTQEYLIVVLLIGIPDKVPAQISDQLFLNQITQKISFFFGSEDLVPPVELKVKMKQAARYTKEPQPIILVHQEFFDRLKADFPENLENFFGLLLAHELVHHFYKHPFQNRQATKTYEIEADRWGGFYAYLAGYNIDQEMVNSLFSLMYDYYQLEEGNPRYPDQEERIKSILEKVQQARATNFPEVFRASKFFYVMGEYEASRLCLEFLYDKGFKNLSLRNNLAVAYLREILNSPRYRRLLFTFPLEFVLESQKKGVEDDLGLEELFFKAENQFRTIIYQNKHYTPAYYNYALLLVLQEKYASALEVLSSLRKYHSANDPKAELIRAMIYAYQDDSEKTLRAFQNAMSGGDYLAHYNYALYKELITIVQPFTKALSSLNLAEIIEIQDRVKNTPPGGRADAESLPRFNSDASLDEVPLQYVKRLTIHGENPYIELALAAPHSQLSYWKIKLRNNEGLSRYLLASTRSDHPGRKKGLAIGDDPRVILEDPQKGRPSLQLRNFIFYREENMYFEVFQNRIMGWTMYQSQ